MIEPGYKSYPFVRDFLCSLFWLLLIAILNQKSSEPVISIFPYLFPVVFITWRYGIGWGFVIAAVGTLAAVPGDYMKDHVANDLYWAAFTTYTKLSAAAIGLALGKYVTVHRKDNK